MTSRWTGFRSPLAVGIEMFLAHKQALGYHLRTTESVLRLLDRFLVEQQVETNEAITPADRCVSGVSSSHGAAQLQSTAGDRDTPVRMADRT